MKPAEGATPGDLAEEGRRFPVEVPGHEVGGQRDREPAENALEGGADTADFDREFI